jgi:hypothetical protein
MRRSSVSAARVQRLSIKAILPPAIADFLAASPRRKRADVLRDQTTARQRASMAMAMWR